MADKISKLKQELKENNPDKVIVSYNPLYTKADLEDIKKKIVEI